MEDVKSDMNFFIPITFEKATTKKGEKIMKIKGVASTADVDSDGEILDPMGFDLTRFLRGGFLNWNHQSKTMGAGAIIGEPTSAIVNSKGELEVTGILYSGHNLAESVYSLAETLERNGSKRRLGFSIEGKALSRDLQNPKKITSALLTGLAVTHVPVNTHTYLDLVKGVQSEDFFEMDEPDLLQKAEESKYLYEFQNNGRKYGITKSFSVEEIEKGRGNKAEVGEIREFSGQKYQKQPDKSWKAIGDPDPSFKRPERKKTWVDFLPYRDYSVLSESIKKMSGEEIKTLLENKIKKRDNSMTSSSDKSRLRSEIWNLEKIVEAHSKASEIDKCMDTTSTAPLVPESLDKKPKVLEPSIKKAIVNGWIPIEWIYSRLK